MFKVEWWRGEWELIVKIRLHNEQVIAEGKIPTLSHARDKGGAVGHPRGLALFFQF
jgi:hypothetical protein